MDFFLIAYLLLLAAYRISENVVMAKTGTMTKRPKRDWTVLLIWVPFVLVLLIPALETERLMGEYFRVQLSPHGNQ